MDKTMDGEQCSLCANPATHEETLFDGRRKTLCIRCYQETVDPPPHLCGYSSWMLKLRNECRRITRCLLPTSHDNSWDNAVKLIEDCYVK